MLKLDNNNLKRIDATVLVVIKNSPSMAELTFDNNPWICDCDALHLRTFIHQNLVGTPSLVKIFCSEANKPLFEMTEKELCADENTTFIIGFYVLVFICILLASTQAAISYKFRKEIKVWWFSKSTDKFYYTSLCKRTSQEDDNNTFEMNKRTTKNDVIDSNEESSVPCS